MSATLSPIALDEVSSVVRSNVGPNAPRKLKLMVARGLVPMSPRDLVTAQFLLTAQADEFVADVAASSLAELNVRIANAVLADTLVHPDVLAYLAQSFASKDDYVEKLLLNPSTPIDAHIEVAKVCSERICEIIASNQRNLLDQPAIGGELVNNPNIRKSTADQAADFMVRSGVVLENIPAFDEALLRLAEPPKTQTTDPSLDGPLQYPLMIPSGALSTDVARSFMPTPWVERTADGGPIVGIHFGTTNACVAVMDGQSVVVIPNADGARSTPSVVAFSDNGRRLVGEKAKRQALMNPENTIVGVKKRLGHAVKRKDRKRVTDSNLIPAPDGRTYSPREISAMILTYIRETAQDYLGESVTDAVVSVPASFDVSQRQAVIDAARIAGLSVRALINEPVAAVFAHHDDIPDPGTVAVFHLGGASLEVSIVERQGNTIDMRGAARANIGGDDFDRRIADYLIDVFSRAYPDYSLANDPMALQRINGAAEKAKIELSWSETTHVNLPFIAADERGPRHLSCTLTRLQLESLVDDLIQEALVPCRRVLIESGLHRRDIDRVLLIGGQTATPRVRDVVEAFFDRAALSSTEPEETVAVGAAYFGATVAAERQMFGRMELDVRADALRAILETTLGTRDARRASRERSKEPGATVDVLSRGTPITHRADRKLCDLLGIGEPSIVQFVAALASCRTVVIRASQFLATLGDGSDEWRTVGANDKLRSDLLTNLGRLEAIQENLGSTYPVLTPRAQVSVRNLRRQVELWEPPAVSSALTSAAANVVATLEAT